MRPVRRALSRALALMVHGGVRLTGRTPRMILTYHRVGTGPGQADREVFAAQLRRAKARGYEFVTVSRLVDGLRYGTDLPPRAVALTFDDGLADTAQVVAPLLREQGVVATVFPILSFLGGQRRYASARSRCFLLEDDGDPQTVAYDYMSWEELDRWVEAGGEVGGHTLTHPFLGEVDEATGLAEIRGCRDRLAARYTKPPRIFCYPYGDDSGRAGTWVRQVGFEAAVTGHEGIVDGRDDLHHLRRLPGAVTAGAEFDDLLAGVFLWRDRLRRRRRA